MLDDGFKYIEIRFPLSCIRDHQRAWPGMSWDPRCSRQQLREFLRRDWAKESTKMIWCPKDKAHQIAEAQLGTASFREPSGIASAGAGEAQGAGSDFRCLELVTLNEAP